jgi:hypothetical protein
MVLEWFDDYWQPQLFFAAINLSILIQLVCIVPITNNKEAARVESSLLSVCSFLWLSISRCLFKNFRQFFIHGVITFTAVAITANDHAVGAYQYPGRQ